MSTEKNCKWKKYFVAKETLVGEMQALGKYFNEELIRKIVDKRLIITIKDDGREYYHHTDVDLCRKIMKLNWNLDIVAEKKNIWYMDGFLVDIIKLTEDTYMIYNINDSQKPVPAYVRNILYFFCVENARCERCEQQQYELLGINVVTTNKQICDYLENAIYREFQLSRVKTSNYANSSSYMGTKKQIVGFIIESIFPHCKEDGCIMDIMCGSGAVSNALAQMGEVYASDAMIFCRLLAKIQGKGMSKKRARQILEEIYFNYNKNLKKLQHQFLYALIEEDKIFHMDLEDDETVLGYYEQWIKTFELYSSEGIVSKEISEKINARKMNPKIEPYCLFTYYYSNIYFGLAQCVQIDSIRYAIEQMEDESEKAWALGVLVIVVSVIGTTYGGHFAQPLKLDIKSLRYVLGQRERSAWLEFSKRLLSIAEESERYPYEVLMVEGPWREALAYIKSKKDNNWIIYLDAPYKREEYSRYYHILETVVRYNYPEAQNKGRLPSKEKGERFVTEFFTKKITKAENAYVNIITEILSIGAVCAWSYSDNGMVSLRNVLIKVQEKCSCKVYLYETPYQHLVQGKRKEKRTSRMYVSEYCIVLSPNGKKE